MALCHLTGRLELPTWSDREGGVEAELRTSSSCRLKESEYQDVSLESAGRLIPPRGRHIWTVVAVTKPPKTEAHAVNDTTQQPFSPPSPCALSIREIKKNT